MFSSIVDSCSWLKLVHKFGEQDMQYWRLCQRLLNVSLILDSSGQLKLDAQF